MVQLLCAQDVFISVDTTHEDSSTVGCRTVSPGVWFLMSK